jgi:hypothetical protein
MDMQTIGKMFHTDPTIAIVILGQANVMVFMPLMTHKGMAFKLSRATPHRIPITGKSSTHNKEGN